MDFREKISSLLARIPLPEKTIYDFLTVASIFLLAGGLNFILSYPANYAVKKFLKTPDVKTRFTLPPEIKNLDQITKNKQKILANLKLLTSYNYQFDKNLPDIKLPEAVLPKPKPSPKKTTKPPREIKINIKISAIIYVPGHTSLIKLNNRTMKAGDVLDFGFINNVPCALTIVAIKKGCVEVLLRKGKKEISRCLKPGDYVL